MIIQTNPEAFSSRLPVHKVTNIDRSTGTVTLSGSAGSSRDVPLSAWGNISACHPDIGSQVQLLNETH